ncbi:TPA: hypothetical protein ACGSTL_001234 [Vibrio parahaemolyticus]|uniref:hypothetical protein n=1 Tax=Vibrio campbellii TaxID=680 RepID=UPI001F079FF4|nr:hypothetical protein [Vibrio campbellii]UMM06652.1 hypothetical protein MKR81_27275 [Vibrio campbellii]
MKYSKNNLVKSVFLNAALEPVNVIVGFSSVALVVLSIFSDERIPFLIGSVALLFVFGILTLGMMKKNARKYGEVYFQALHKHQMAQLNEQLKGLDKTPLVKESEQLLKMYWNLRLSGNLSEGRKDTLADATERYFSIMTSSLSALARLPKTSQEGLQEIRKLHSLSSAYKSALVSECIAQTSAGNKEGFSDLLNKLEAIKISNDEFVMS